MRSFLTLAAAALALAGAPGCAHQPPLPLTPADVRGTVWAIQGSFEGGGTLVVRPDAVPGLPAPLSARVQIRPGTRIVVRRTGKLASVNFSRLQLGQRVTGWWDGAPATDDTGAPTGAVRVLVIELDATKGARRPASPGAARVPGQ